MSSDQRHEDLTCGACGEVHEGDCPPLTVAQEAEMVLHEDLFTSLLVPRSPEERKARRLSSVQEGIEAAKRVTEPATPERRLLISLLHRLRNYEETQ